MRENYKQSIALSFNFLTAITSITLEEYKYECKYLRYVPNQKNKMFTVRSSAFNSYFHILPTKNNKYKILILDSE